ncbi:hypothetical protein KDH_00950 [Dictyobacter sp. S3.2.2.5]|uniref:N-acetylmuramoyl-L-alanine amidase n=1 Tax=Dictyobacter halimunensis TaxID=3026934 RepID=A0ABQ6FGZ5_9CHLR|nr:hypothetical protein KDH_00950 [Dictyobacter sp. S3.2.2.5]
MRVDEAGALAIWVPQEITFEYTDAIWLVVHKTAGFHTAQECAAYFGDLSRNTEHVSSHYVVGQDGTIVQCVPEGAGAGANCCTIGNYAPFLPFCNGQNNNLNVHTISIEHIDPSIDNSTPLTSAQKAASFSLIKHICQRHSIPMRAGDSNGGIIGHFQIDSINRAHCPGNYPWQALWDYLAPPIPQLENSEVFTTQSADFHPYFVEQTPGGLWQCRHTRCLLGGNIRKYYSNLTIDGQTLPIIGLPTTNEIAVGAKRVQHFEKAVLCYDPTITAQPPGAEYKVYLLKLDDPLLGAK